MGYRIVYCIPSLHISGGMERVVTNKANYLAEVYGHEVIIVSTEASNKQAFYPLSPAIKRINLAVNFDHLNGKPFLRRVFGYLIKQWKYKKKLRSCLMDLKPDITISMLRREVNFIAGIKDGSIKIGEIHINRDNYRDLKGSRLMLLLSRIWMAQLIHALKKLDHFVVLSQEDRKKWPEIKAISVINNPLSFYPEITSDCLEKEVLAVGRYVYSKGFDLLIEAWSMVAAKHPEWRLRIVGAGDRMPYEEQAKNLGIEKYCLLENEVPDIVDKYLQSGFLVMSSRFEGWGLVITEAMTCGLPVVSFDSPPKELINDGQDGFMVKTGDIEALAGKMLFLIENEAIRKQMGQKARINSERFRLENIMAKWQSLFSDLMNNR
ncbi:MAG: glycosyltransferase family 4 protein [Bacteroidales bacterium]|nr:glycosyltransferase family 4 protein [Bacteroidales bacterium]MDD4641500.1 glycosyltransferase family 4 protein [Bacteroidales bacterium]